MSEDMKTAVVAALMWFAVGMLVALAWALMVLDSDHLWKWSLLFALTGCATSAGAATLHIKTYNLRTHELVRACSGLGGEQHAAIRSLR